MEHCTQCKAQIRCFSQGLFRAGGTGPAAPVLAGPIFEAPTIHFKLKPKKEHLQKRRDLARNRSSHAM